MSSPIRAFIAVSISAEARDALKAVIDELRRSAPREVRWTRSEEIHLTLKFLGDIPPERVEEISEALGNASRAIKPFDLRLSTLGAFPHPENPKVLWIGLAGDLKPLQKLQEEVEEQLEALGFPRERRTFTPHLTLGRARDKLQPCQRQRLTETLEKGVPHTAPEWNVTAVHLIRSTLSPKGPVYQGLGSIPLQSTVRARG